MQEQDRRLLQGMMHFSRRLHDASRRGMDAALAGLPKCHYPLLERVYYTIRQQGSGGQIYVSELVKAMQRPAPAVSRDLRVLEQEGLIARSTDPDDRRKIFVRLTPEGERCRDAFEEAVLAYAKGIVNRLGPERLAQMTDLMHDFERAVAEESAAAHPAPPQTSTTPNDKENEADDSDF